MSPPCRVLNFDRSRICTRDSGHDGPHDFSMGFTNRPAGEEECICPDVPPAIGRLHCKVHGMFFGLSRDQLRERIDELERRLAAHHAHGAMDGVRPGDRWHVCNPEEAT